LDALDRLAEANAGYEQAWAMNYPSAAVNLASNYTNGVGLPRDLAKARQLASIIHQGE
jgi:TPR repeat protein